MSNYYLVPNQQKSYFIQKSIQYCVVKFVYAHTYTLNTEYKHICIPRPIIWIRILRSPDIHTRIFVRKSKLFTLSAGQIWIKTIKILKYTSVQFIEKALVWVKRSIFVYSFLLGSAFFWIPVLFYRPIGQNGLGLRDL